ncbi:hypothetical protein WME97_41270 [Sorangium sp. So ce367]|uniref:hypothetical protein n=1 Tax=Sorangium sp. So ce367 TaxID=3133305 RepID=UPI003F5E468D
MKSHLVPCVRNPAEEIRSEAGEANFNIAQVLVEPLRTACEFVCWLSAYGSRRAAWRGNGFTIGLRTELVAEDDPPTLRLLGR